MYARVTVCRFWVRVGDLWKVGGSGPPMSHDLKIRKL